MLIRHFVPPPWVIDRLWQNRVIVQKQNVLSRVHEALLKISLLVPLAPSRLFPMLAQQLPKINKKDQVGLSFFFFFGVNLAHAADKLTRNYFYRLAGGGDLCGELIKAGE